MIPTPRSLRRPVVLGAGLAVLAAPMVWLPASGTPAAIAAVHATTETPAQFDDDAGGNADADDPAIWRNKLQPAKSLVITTAKEGGLKVYNLSGAQVQALPVPPAPAPGLETGRFNNVDLLSGVRFADGLADVAVVSDRGRDRIRTYRINPNNATSPLTDVTAASVPRVFSATEAEVEDQNTAYGLASYTDPETGRHYAIASRRNHTSLKLVELKVAAGKITYSPVRSYHLPATFTLPDGTSWTPCDEPGSTPQVEGMVVDTDTGKLYAGQEDVGIWKLDADLSGPATMVDKVREFGVPGTYDPEADECTAGADPGYGGRHVTADVEGLTIFDDGDGEGYLLASSQGDNTFVAYDREGSNPYLTNFRISAGGTVDGSEECDGAMVSSASFGSAYPDGLLVVQDGFNAPDVIGDDGEPRANTNFKFVSWDDVADETGLDD
ncbi:3-phytase [Kribbella flavida DSM 17836]|uniref:3-phytase n=1 Tax=Kribbella flavida (strain DSM 17836 / JCM 10339 / NBRC 14399) TaxID=479435 RepID=D2PPX8_KRIFD|nr:phytase [Kribbella flavida]ADB32902.1 3-phytase [Kribbella flavida DSM 17836]